MTEVSEFLGGVVVLLLCVLIALRMRRRPPQLDAERWFKLVLATVLRGDAEREEQTVETWEKQVIEWIPYHPAGRFPEQKLQNPRPEALQSPALPGELALVEALSKLPGVTERLHHLYDVSEAGVRARLIDPETLGDEYDPGRYLAGTSWDSVAAWDLSTRQAIRDRFGASWVCVAGPPDCEGVVGLMDAIASCGEGRVVPWDTDESASVEALRAVVEAACARAEDRVVLVGEEAGVLRILKLLVSAPEVRDRVVAVLSVGGLLDGRREPGAYGQAEVRDWMQAWFKEDELDTEIVPVTPYLAVQWLDRSVRPPGVAGLPLEAQRFPELVAESAVGRMVQRVDSDP